MPFIHCWKLVCCDAELELGFDAITNISANIFDDFMEFVSFGRTLGLLYPPAAKIESFFREHKDHRIERRISEKELEKNHEENKKEEKYAVMFSCTCGEMSVSPVSTLLEEDFAEKPFTADMLEKYYRMLELYNLFGCLFDNHSWSDALEQQLPFLKKHVGHGIVYGAVGVGETTGLKSGRYEHYKGKQYEVIGLARHSETLEVLVIYRALYDSEEFGKNALWARPKSMFLETVNIHGKDIPRFRRIE